MMRLAWMIVASLAGLSAAAEVKWPRMSLPAPNAGDQQTCLVVADFDGDGAEDFAVGERTKAPGVVWYRWNGKEFERRVIDDGRLNPEAGGEAFDIDGDGDRDLVLAQDYSGSAVWWWENPRPDFSKPWRRHFIKNAGEKKHHDQSAADFDGDGKVELLSWNQGGRQLLLWPIPARPADPAAWKATAIYSWEGGQELEGFPSIPTDIDGDGKVDIVGGGRWFKHREGMKFEPMVVDDAMRFTQCAAGQLVEGGRAEIVFSPGDADGEAKWYEWNGGRWVPHVLGKVIHGHTCEVRDIDRDGRLDVLIGEMGSPGAGDQARIIIWYGDGKGGFREMIALRGQGIHEGRLADLDGDGDLDLIVKPYHHNAPRLEVLWQGEPGSGRRR